MTIYNPRLFFTADDKELLMLLSELLVHSDRNSKHSNYPAGKTVLSDQEAETLLVLLEQFAHSRKFVEGSYFVERLLGVDPDDAELRNIFLSWRKRLGRTRSMATAQWQNFTNRLGLTQHRGGYLAGTHAIQARQMDLSHFQLMEKKLLRSANLSPRVRSILLHFIDGRIDFLRNVLEGEIKFQPNTIRKVPTDFALELKEARKSKTGVPPVSAAKLAGIMTIVVDFSAIFTTRDWSVASVLSTTAGASIYSSFE